MQRRNQQQRRQKPVQKTALPRPPRREFEAEGNLEIANFDGVEVFQIDGCALSQFVARHFAARSNDEGLRNLGRCKVLIIPVRE